MKKLGDLILVVCLCVPVVGLANGCGCLSEAMCCDQFCDPCKCKKTPPTTTTTTVTEESHATSPDYKYTEYTLLEDTVVYNSCTGTASDITLPAGTTVLLGTPIMGRVNILYDNEQRAGYIALEGDGVALKLWSNRMIDSLPETRSPEDYIYLQNQGKIP